MSQAGISALGLHNSDISCTYTGCVPYPGLSASRASRTAEDQHKLSPDHPRVKDFESGFFPVKTKLLLLGPSPVYASINDNNTVKMGLPKQFCILRLNFMHLPCICGALMLKAGCFSLEFICSRFPSQWSVIHSASVSLYKGKQSVGSLKGESHKYFKHFLTSLRKKMYM